MKTNSIIVIFYLCIFYSSCGINNNLREQNIKTDDSTLFINVTNPKGSIVQNDTTQFIITFNEPTTLVYYNSNFSRNSYRDYQFEVVLHDIFEKPLFIKMTNYYGFLQFSWRLKKIKNQYVLQMTSTIKDGVIIDEFELEKTGKYYSLSMIRNITPIFLDGKRAKQICFLPSIELKKDTIDCTINKFIECNVFNYLYK